MYCFGEKLKDSRNARERFSFVTTSARLLAASHLDFSPHSLPLQDFSINW